MMNNYVFADDDLEVVIVSDPGTWAAFEYFQNYGFKSSFENTETQIYTTSGTNTLTGNFTFTGTFTGSFDATVRMAVDTLIGTDLNDVDNILTGYTHYYLDKDEVQLTIHPTDNATQQNNGFALGCVYNAQSTSATAEMNCTPTSGLAQTIILPDAEITFDSIDTLFNSVTNYSVALTLRNEGTVVGSLTGTLSGSIGGSGTVSLSGIYNETTTTQNKTKFQFTMPYMKHSTGTLTPLSYSNNKRFIGSTDDPFVCYYMANNRSIYSAITIKQLNSNDNVTGSDVIYVRKDIFGISNYLQLAGFEYYGGGAWMNYGLLGNGNPWTYTDFLYPLYVGKKSQMSDELYRFIYGEDRTLNELTSFHHDMVSGNQYSHAAANGMNQVEQDFVDKTDELIDFEGDTFNSMDSAIDGVQLNNNLISGSGFLNAANWVRVQFDNLISYSPLSSILVFSLSLGFALLIIGKVR